MLFLLINKIRTKASKTTTPPPPPPQPPPILATTTTTTGIDRLDPTTTTKGVAGIYGMNSEANFFEKKTFSDLFLQVNNSNKNNN